MNEQNQPKFFCRVCHKDLSNNDHFLYNDHLDANGYYRYPYPQCTQPICQNCAKTNPDVFHKAYQNDMNEAAKRKADDSVVKATQHSYTSSITTLVLALLIIFTYFATQNADKQWKEDGLEIQNTAKALTLEYGDAIKSKNENDILSAGRKLKQYIEDPNHYSRLNSDGWADRTLAIIAENEKPQSTSSQSTSSSGTLLVAADSGAKLYIDGSYRGKGSFSMSLAPGTYIISAYSSSTGKLCWEQRMIIYSGKPSVLRNNAWCR